MSNEANGIFISYRRSYAFFAGRINDYLFNKGYAPFMDVYRMKQDYFDEFIINKIKNCPYFLLVLSSDCLKNLTDKDMFFREIKTAFDVKEPQDILIVADEDFVNNKEKYVSNCNAFSEDLKNKLCYHQCDVVSHANFNHDMKRLMDNIETDKLGDNINWKGFIYANASTLLSSRKIIENKYASFEKRFGTELVSAVKKGEKYNGNRIVKRIRLSCYSANIVFNPVRNMVDDYAFDNGLMFNIFRELLRDPDFSMEIIINAPNSIGANEAIRNDMLGNSALEIHPEACFFGAYAGLSKLINEDDVFKMAYKEKRFRFYLTNVVMLGATMITEYKENWSQFDNIKYDIYGYNLSSNMDRRSLIAFRDNDNGCYNYFLSMYQYLKKHTYSNYDIKLQRDDWIASWKKLEEEL